MPGCGLRPALDEMTARLFPGDSSYKSPSASLLCCFPSSHFQSLFRFPIHSFVVQFCELPLLHILYCSIHTI
jgi:hypothetical protein